MKRHAEDSSGYALIDFGDGRKLERFGSVVVDRPCPAAEGKSSLASQQARWENADLVFGSKWKAASRIGQQALKEGWETTLELPQGTLVWQLRATPAGQVGMFPEHIANFESFLKASLGKVNETTERPTLLSLFAYTGLGSVQCAIAGCHVTHVDASKPSVHWAKENFQANTAEYESHSQSIRYLVDDAMAFCRREVRRGKKYDLISLDPPTYGHGPEGKAWRIDRDLPLLFEVLDELLSDRALGVMLCGHTELDRWEATLEHPVFDRFHHRFVRSQFDSIHLSSLDNRRLHFGHRQIWAGKR